MDAFHCAETLKTAQDSYGKTEIFHSDQGSQFTSSESVAEFRNHGIQISMDGCGRCLDNAKMERFSQSLKYGDIKIKENVSLPQIRFGVQHYVNVCHSGRIPSPFQSRSPDEVCFGTCNRPTMGYSKPRRLHQSSHKNCPGGGETRTFLQNVLSIVKPETSIKL